MYPQAKTKIGFCIYIDTVLQGPLPVERDERGNPVVYATMLEAQRVIAEDTIERICQFLENQRDFDDAMTVEEYVEEVDVLPDDSIWDKDDRHFGHENW